MNSIFYRFLKSRQYFFNVSQLSTAFLLKNSNKPCSVIYQNKVEPCYSSNGGSLYFIYSLSFFGLFKKDEETPNDKLITTIKRSILCIQREQYDKAEQMLHLALRMAQDLKSRDGITYVYDVMANLAMEREQYKKAEKLFADVLRRILSDGVSEVSPKVLHISSKIAHMAQLQGDLEKSKVGFTWTLAKIEECMKKMPDDTDIKELWALTRNWFGQLLMKESKYIEAKQCFKDAYDYFVTRYGAANEEVITILNNLSVACVNMNNFNEAKGYILEALELIKAMKESSQEAILKANLGLIYLREGLVKEAKSSCSHAWKIAKSQKDEAGLEQAEYCLNEINTHS